MYDFTKIHNDILEQLSKLDKCSNFILTEQQFKNALDTNQQIIKPYIGFTNEKKEYINIRDFVLDKLQKYKIVGVKTGKYGVIDYTEINRSYNSPNIPNDNYFYIIFINIHGDTYGNIFLENRWKERYDRRLQQLKFIPNDWFLELFIKPFAIKPEHCNVKCYTIYKKIIECFVNYISLFNDDLYWSPYIDKNHYSCKSYCIDDNIIELYEEPKYKEYIETDKNISKNVMNDILNDKILLEYNIKCHILDIYDCTITKKYHPLILRPLIYYSYIINWNKLYNYCSKNYKMNNFYIISLYNNINNNMYHNFNYVDKKIDVDFLPKNINLNLFECCYLSSLIEIHQGQLKFNPYSKNIWNNTFISKGTFLNIYDIYYKTHLDIKEINKKYEEIININNNILTIENYHKPILNLYDYLPIKTLKILKNGSLIDKEYTDINEIHIKKSNIINININETIKDVNIIKLYECKKFKNISINIRKNLKSLYIDDALIEIEIEETKAKNRKPRKL
jgi:hypothetical protein